MLCIYTDSFVGFADVTAGARHSQERGHRPLYTILSGGFHGGSCGSPAMASRKES